LWGDGEVSVVVTIVDVGQEGEREREEKGVREGGR
jgi:hypothetical protein